MTDTLARLAPNCAYGDLLVKQNGRLRHSVAARVDLSSGALHLEQTLSRDAYDWGCDDLSFRVRGSREAVNVEEGTEFEADTQVDFCIHPSDLPDLVRAWNRYQGGTPTVRSSKPGR